MVSHGASKASVHQICLVKIKMLGEKKFKTLRAGPHPKSF